MYQTEIVQVLLKCYLLDFTVLCCWAAAESVQPGMVERKIKQSRSEGAVRGRSPETEQEALYEPGIAGLSYQREAS